MKEKETPIKYIHTTTFQINIESLECGWETISMSFNGIRISFRASYIGSEPLRTFIEAVHSLDREYISESDESIYYIDWTSEPGCMELSLKRNLSNDQLSIEIKESEYEDINDRSTIQWNFVMNYSLFRQAVIEITIASLNKYGICGFNNNWDVDSAVLPIGTILSILGAKTDSDKDSHSFRSNLTEEIAILTSIISENEP